MSDRRNFLRLASAAAMPAASAIVSSGVARAADGAGFLGAWSTLHSLPFPPGNFREFLSFAAGGVLHETNSFLHTASNVDFSIYGLPNVVNAADGVGSWTDLGNGLGQVVFRKMMFDGSRQNFGDLYVTGNLRTNGAYLSANWHISVVDPLGNVIVDLGAATSEGALMR